MDSTRTVTPLEDLQPTDSDGEPATASRHRERVGEILGGRYRITRFIAEGGMGLVYEAHHMVVKRRFAVKLLRSDFSQRRDFLARFQREAEAGGTIECDNIAIAVDFGLAVDGSPYIVMEYLVGESLATVLARERRLPLERAADLCAQACRGTQAAHAAGIVHRDLKPENLFLCRREDGTDLLKVLDFGVAKLAEIAHEGATTQTGTLLGTPAYMSPEQARGERSVGPRSDVYALGAILFEMLTGQRPHPGDSNNAILHHISTQPALSLDDVAPGLPSALVAAVASALAGNPADRPPSAEALARLVSPLAKRIAWTAVNHPTGRALSTTVLAPIAQPLETLAAQSLDEGTTNGQASPQATRRRRWRAIAGLASGGIVVILLAVGVGRRPRPEAPRPSPASALSPGPSRPSQAESADPPAPAPTPGATVAPVSPQAKGRPHDRRSKRPVSQASDQQREQAGHRTAGPTVKPGATPRPPVVRATFDPQNPYATE